MQSKFVYAIFALVVIAVTVTVSWELGHILVQQSQETLFGVILALLAAAGVSSIAVVATYSKLYTSRQQCRMLLRDLAFERKEYANFRTDAQAQIRTLRAKLRSETESAQHAAAGAREQVQSIHGVNVSRTGFTADYTSRVQAPYMHAETDTPLNPVNIAVAATLLDYSASAESSVTVPCTPVTDSSNTPTVIETPACLDTSSYNSGDSSYCDSGGSSYCDSGSSNTGD